jgi:3' terminal RNA ribose 2'-O-methyltransferase Hen1
VRRQGSQIALDAYVNDRPYVASSFMSVAIAEVFSSALNGHSRERADLVSKPMPLHVRVAAVPCRGGEALVQKLFGPLGYDVSVTRYPLDERFPEWGESRYFDVELTAECPLQRVLRHLYVLLPVLDDDKHYWVSRDEVEKLLRHGDEWLSAHPEKKLITERYLSHQRELSRDALARLLEETATDPDAEEEAESREEAEVAEKKLGLGEQRIGAVLSVLRGSGARRVLDLGCGEGQLLARLAKERSFDEVLGVDVSVGRLQRAVRRLKLDQRSEAARPRVKLVHGSLTYRDRRLAGYDAAAVVEVVEHLDQPRLAAFERALFGAAAPRTVALTTPNVEYNVRYESLPAGRFRHRDHRFEWTRAEFRDWSGAVCQRYGYETRFVPIGTDDPEVGPPTQMAVFTKSNETEVRDAAHDS